MRLETLQVGYIGTNCYLVMDEGSHEGFIVDPGGDDMRIAAAADRMGMLPKAILLTHGHFDHIMAVNELKEKFTIPVYCLSAEAELLKDPRLNSSDGLIRHPYSTEADILLEDGELFSLAGFKIRTLATPGHTRGGACYYLEEEGILFSGDTLFKESVGRTDLPTGNAHLLLESVRNKLKVLPPETKVYPGHGEDTTIGYEKRNNIYMRDEALYD